PRRRSRLPAAPNRSRDACAMSAAQRPMTAIPAIRVSRDENPNADVAREWLVTNGLGGFASATISGEITRRYHGLLIAALPAPLGRIVMLSDVEAEIERADGTTAN